MGKTQTGNLKKALLTALLAALCLLFTVQAKAAVTVGVPVVSGKASGSMITLSWNKVPNARGYSILMYQSQTRTYRYLSTVWTTGNGKFTYKRPFNGTYYFKVRAIRDYRGKRYYGSSSKAVAVKTAISPSPSLTYGKWETAGGTRCIRIHWKKNSLADGYVVFRSTKRDTGYKVVATFYGNKTFAYRDKGVRRNTTYYYRVKTFRKNSGKSNYVFSSLGNPRMVLADTKANPTPTPTPTPKPVPTTMPSPGGSRRALVVGDSRVDIMKDYFGNSSFVTWYGKSGEGLRWLQNTAASYIANTLDGNTDLFIWLGTNDTYNIQNYVTYYKSMIPRWKSLGAKVYLVAVGPENLPAFGEEDTTAEIVAYNAKLKACAQETGASYIDLYTYLVNNKYTTVDGSHYDRETCIKIYNYLMTFFGR